MKEVFVVEGFYDEEDGGERNGGILGVYSNLELAERAADKYISLAESDPFYCARNTRVDTWTVDLGWYEDYWLEKEEQ